MREIPIYEARRQLGALVIDAMGGKGATLTRYGRPAAALLAVGTVDTDPSDDRASVDEARAQFGALIVRVMNGERIVITRYADPAAVLAPVPTDHLDDVEP